MNGIVARMGITLGHRSALEVLRAARVAAGGEGISWDVTGLIEPRPDEGTRWAKRAVTELKCNAGLPLDIPVDVLVSDPKRRIRAAGMSCHVWNSHVPGLCFARLNGSNNAIPLPEILLLQMAESLSKPQLIALGHELCGRYALRPTISPGPATTDLPPASSASSIMELLRGVRGLHGITALRRAVPYIRDNSYSPMETSLSVMAQLPLEESGYQVGDVTLNARIEPVPSVSDFVEAGSRMPDILFCGTPVGINYDGDCHLNLAKVESAAVALASSPGNLTLSQGLKTALDGARKDISADKQRDRDLLAMGYFILPVTKLDLATIESLDRLMGQVMTLIERTCGTDLSLQKEALRDPWLKRERAKLLLALKRN